MKVKMLLVAAAIIAFAAAGFGQGFQYTLNNAIIGDPIYDGVMLTKACTGPLSTVGIGDGEGTVYVYQDADNNGATDNDHLVTLCTTPPACETGPAGTFNFNSFPMNGESFGLPAGFFVGDRYLVCNGALPAGTPKFYIRVKYPTVNPTIEWVSNVKTGASDAHDDWFFTSWTCHELVPPCTPTGNMTVPAIPVGTTGPSYCNVILCPNTTFTLCVGPVPQQDRIPNFSVTPCVEGAALPAGLVTSWNGYTGWTWTTVNDQNFYCGTITVTGPGCVCLNYDGQLPVELGNFAANGMDNSVKVAWNTLSENAQERFDIIRDGVRIGSKAATNNATGATYEFVDNSAVNGTTYSYELVAVALDGTVRSLATASATPDMNNAVITEYALLQNFPNPFNPSTKIAFDLVENNTVSLTIYNAAGQEVTTLMSNRSMTKGRHSVSFDATNLTSGLYFYSIKIGNEFSATKKMLLVK